MQKVEYNDDVDMLFSSGQDWHLDIRLPLNAQITEIHLRVYSFSFPDNIYNISWNPIKQAGRFLHIPIDASRTGHSKPDEVVRLAFDITYYFDSSPSLPK